MKYKFPIIVAFTWAFVAIEIAFHLNILFHWSAIDWRDLNALNNRPAFAMCLVGCLAACYSESDDWSGRLFLWLPISSVMFFVFLPSERIWHSIVETSNYAERTSYAAGQHIYTAVLFFPVFMFFHRWHKRLEE